MLMGFCLIATIAGVFKVIVLNSYDALSENAVADMMTVYLWHVLSSPDCVRASELTRGVCCRIRIEELILLIAACAPLLKRPIENLLQRLALPGFRPRANGLDSILTLRSSTRKPGHCNGPEGPQTSTDLEANRSGMQGPVVTGTSTSN